MSKRLYSVTLPAITYTHLDSQCEWCTAHIGTMQNLQWQCAWVGGKNQDVRWDFAREEDLTLFVLTWA